MEKKLNNLKLFYFTYLHFILKYFSFKKLFNLVLNLYEYKTKKIILRSIPFLINFDVSNLCVLKCPLCPTGRGDKRQTKGVMKFEDFKVVFDKVKDYLFFVWLYNWGEPFMCQDIFKIVDYCHKNKVGVRLHSNLNYYNDSIIKNIVKSKIDYISLSIDGFTQKNYRFYRKNGDINKVFSGIKKIQKYKKEFKSKRPILVWQYLINNRNQGEVEQARLFALSNKIDFFDSRPLFLFMDTELKYRKSDYEKFLSKTSVTEKNAQTIKSKSSCRFLWCSLAVNPNSSYLPCCIAYRDSEIFGTFKNNRQTINSVINSQIFVESRKLFKNFNYQPECFTPCLSCGWFTKAGEI